MKKYISILLIMFISFIFIGSVNAVTYTKEELNTTLGDYCNGDKKLNGCNYDSNSNKFNLIHEFPTYASIHDDYCTPRKEERGECDKSDKNTQSIVVNMKPTKLYATLDQNKRVVLAACYKIDTSTFDVPEGNSLDNYLLEKGVYYIFKVFMGFSGDDCHTSHHNKIMIPSKGLSKFSDGKKTDSKYDGSEIRVPIPNDSNFGNYNYATFENWTATSTSGCPKYFGSVINMPLTFARKDFFVFSNNEKDITTDRKSSASAEPLQYSLSCDAKKAEENRESKSEMKTPDNSISDEDMTCKQILGEPLGTIVKGGIRLIQIAGAIIAIVKGMLILVPAVSAKDTDELKKSTKTLVNLAIVLVLCLLFREIVVIIGQVLGFDVSCVI